jgi:hypothetical protein
MFGLSFLNAGILFVAMAAIIPLLIHLFVKNKPQRIYFSSLRFLRELIEERRKRITLNQLILMLLRMLVILFIVFSLAKPVVRLPFITKFGYHHPTAVAFILDTSPRMDYVINQKTQIQHGIDIIKSISSEMNEKDMSIFFTSDAMRNGMRAVAKHGVLPDSDLSDISYTWTPEPMSTLLRLAESELEQTQFLHKKIFVITDEIASVSGQRASSRWQLDDMKIPFTRVSTFTDTLRINLSVEKVTIKREASDGGMQRVAEYEIVNNSPIALHDQIVRLSLNGTTVSEKMISLSAHERKTDSFVINTENLEWNYGFVEVRDERFLPDNRHYFSFYSDPSPRVAIVSDIGNFPRQVEVLADIFITQLGEVVYLTAEDIQLSDIDRYHFYIFHIQNFTTRIQALITELERRGQHSMFILPTTLADSGKRFFRENFGLEIADMANTGIENVTAYHQWHPIVSQFDFLTALRPRSQAALSIRATGRNVPLVSTDTYPLILENKSIFVNIDFSVAQNFISYPAFPIIIYRSYSWISRYDSRVDDFLVGYPFPPRAGEMRSPTGETSDTMLSGFRFSMPGIWTYTDPTGKSSFISVNVDSYDDISRATKSEGGTDGWVAVDEAGGMWQYGDIFSNVGNEIAKLLLLACLLFLATEMILVLILQKKAA